MKEFLIGWIVCQLIVIGFIGGLIGMQLSNQTFDCTAHFSKRNFQYIIASTVFPLVYFASNEIDKQVDDYCSK